MAREGAQLGVPSIYCGFREMNANKILVDKGMIFEKQPEDVPIFVQSIIDNKVKIKNQNDFRKDLQDQWDDLTQLIISKVESYERK